jgi:hypothetical protein
MKSIHLNSPHNLKRLRLNSNRKLQDIKGLHNLIKIKFLQIEDCNLFSQFENISLLKTLEKLELMYNKKLKSLTFIAVLDKLKSLRVWSVFALKSLDCFTKCQQLEELSIHNADVKTLNGFENLHNLKYLNLGNFHNLKSLDSLSKCTKINDVSFHNLTSLEDMNAIKDFKNLNEFYIDANNLIKNIDFLSHLKNLEIIELSDCNSIQSITPLVKLNKLKSLTINHCYGFTDLHLLKTLKVHSDIGVCYNDEMGFSRTIEFNYTN